jgi:hypothetical protein
MGVWVRPGASLDPVEIAARMKTATETLVSPAVWSLLIVTSVVMDTRETDVTIVLHYSDTGYGPEALCLWH